VKGIKKFSASLITLARNLAFPRRLHGRNKYNGAEIQAGRSALSEAEKRVSGLVNCKCPLKVPLNHRMVEVGRDLCGSSSPTLLLKQGYLQ